MPAAPRSCLHTYGGQDGGRDLYRGLQHHHAGLERDYEQEFTADHGHAQIGQLCADLRRTCHGAAAAHIGGFANLAVIAGEQLARLVKVRVKSGLESRS